MKEICKEETRGKNTELEHTERTTEKQQTSCKPMLLAAQKIKDIRKMKDSNKRRVYKWKYTFEPNKTK